MGNLNLHETCSVTFILCYVTNNEAVGKRSKRGREKKVGKEERRKRRREINEERGGGGGINLKILNNNSKDMQTLFIDVIYIHK